MLKKSAVFLLLCEYEEVKTNTKRWRQQTLLSEVAFTITAARASEACKAGANS
jgi:hypothetical protein